MRSLLFRPAVLLVAACATLAAACPAQEGDVCFVTGDCTTGLTCCKTSASPTARGRCGTVCDTGTDAGPTDAGDRDGGADGGRPDSGLPPCTRASGDPCAALGAYCEVDACGDNGTCVSRPTMCDAVLAPVCGCDGLTYVNECEATAPARPSCRRARAARSTQGRSTPGPPTRARTPAVPTAERPTRARRPRSDHFPPTSRARRSFLAF